MHTSHSIAFTLLRLSADRALLRALLVLAVQLWYPAADWLHLY